MGGCPDGYGSPVTIKQAVKITGSTYESVAAIDKNGDTFVCVTSIPTPPPETHNVIDNNTPS